MPFEIRSAVRQVCALSHTLFARPSNLADVCILRSGVKCSPIARFPAILLYFINRPSGETDCIYETNVK